MKETLDWFKSTPSRLEWMSTGMAEEPEYSLTPTMSPAVAVRELTFINFSGEFFLFFFKHNKYYYYYDTTTPLRFKRLPLIEQRVHWSVDSDRNGQLSFLFRPFSRISHTRKIKIFFIFFKGKKYIEFYVTGESCWTTKGMMYLC